MVEARTDGTGQLRKSLRRRRRRRDVMGMGQCLSIYWNGRTADRRRSCRNKGLSAPPTMTSYKAWQYIQTPPYCKSFAIMNACATLCIGHSGQAGGSGDGDFCVYSNYYPMGSIPPGATDSFHHHVKMNRKAMRFRTHFSYRQSRQGSRGSDPDFHLDGRDHHAAMRGGHVERQHGRGRGGRRGDRGETKVDQLRPIIAPRSVACAQAKMHAMCMRSFDDVACDAQLAAGGRVLERRVSDQQPPRAAIFGHVDEQVRKTSLVVEQRTEYAGPQGPAASGKEMPPAGDTATYRPLRSVTF